MIERTDVSFTVLESLMMLADRVEQVSRDFLGTPYKSDLIGSAETPEIFVSSVDVFDCVTYIETVLAQASTQNPTEFRRRLKQLRYRSGQVSWISRNHYMTNWIRNNTLEGMVREVRLQPAVVKDRLLQTLAGLPPQKQRFRCLPKRLLPASARKLHTGDLIFFASTRSHLDIFHCGIVIKTSGDRLLMRHASRSQGAVVEQELSDFLKENRMAGLIVVRPLDPK